MHSYAFSIENGADNYPQIEPIYRQHYDERRLRLASLGVATADYAPRLDVYFSYWRAGHLLNFIARHDGEPVGYANVYLTSDMHNGELIALEDAIYVLPHHRNGTGRHLAKFVLAELRRRGVRRFTIQAVTDPRAAYLWRRLGFEPTGEVMTFTF